MLRKMSVIDAGDTSMLPGTRVGVLKFTEMNEKALMEGKRPAVASPIILGITKAALDTESFLSSASFQETTKVLTDAACKGKVDHLHGLKENVMIGKLIHAGEEYGRLEIVENVEDDDILLEDFDEEIESESQVENIVNFLDFDEE